ncbi:hypothetical protein MRX96_053266 [Rhipicephalus microplus]
MPRKTETKRKAYSSSGQPSGARLGGCCPFAHEEEENCFTNEQPICVTNSVGRRQGREGFMAVRSHIAHLGARAYERAMIALKTRWRPWQRWTLLPWVAAQLAAPATARDGGRPLPFVTESLGY